MPKLYCAWHGPDEPFDPDFHRREDLSMFAWTYDAEIDTVPEITVSVDNLDILDLLGEEPENFRQMWFIFGDEIAFDGWLDGIEDLGGRQAELRFLCGRDQEKKMREKALELRDAWAVAPDHYYHRLFASPETLEDVDADQIVPDDLMAGRPYSVVWDPITHAPTLVPMAGDENDFLDCYDALADSWSFRTRERPYAKARLKLRCSYEQKIRIRTELSSYLATKVPGAEEYPAGVFARTWDASQAENTLPAPGRDIGNGWIWERASWSLSTDIVQVPHEPPELNQASADTSDELIREGGLWIGVHTITVPIGSGVWLAALDYAQGRNEELTLEMGLEIDERLSFKSSADVLDMGEIEVSDPTEILGIPGWEPGVSYPVDALVVYAERVWRKTEFELFPEEFSYSKWTDEGVAESEAISAPTFLAGPEGIDVIGHALERMKKALLAASFAFEASFDIPYPYDPGEYRLGRRIRIHHARLPSGEAVGVIVGHGLDLKTGLKRMRITVAVMIGTGGEALGGALDHLASDGPSDTIHTTTSGIEWKWPGGDGPPEPSTPGDIARLRLPQFAVRSVKVDGLAKDKFLHPGIRQYIGDDDQEGPADQNIALSMKLVMQPPKEHAPALLRARPIVARQATFKGL